MLLQSTNLIKYWKCINFKNFIIVISGHGRWKRLISFSGRLVRAVEPDGWWWVSSLIRTDTGNGACELVFVEEFEVKLQHL